MTHKYIQDTAKELVQIYDTRDACEIAKQLGVGIKYADIGSLKGMYTTLLGNRFIVINQNLNETEQKSVLAHELGHDRLHHHLTDSVLQDTMLYDMTSQPEYEANLFASELLIDREKFVSMVEQGHDIAHIAAHFGVETPLAEIYFKHHFGGKNEAI